MHYYSAATSKIPNGEIFTSNGVIFTNHPLPAYMNPTYCHNTTLFCSSCYYKETNNYCSKYKDINFQKILITGELAFKLLFFSPFLTMKTTKNICVYSKNFQIILI